jgi:hypothetical protein
MKSQGHGKLRQRKVETLKAKGHRELEDERAPRVGEKQDMAATRGVNPFLKADSSARAPKRHGQGLPRCAPGFPSYDMGPGLTCHTSWPKARKRRIIAQGACNRPAVMCPSISVATSGQGGEPPHKERATAPRLCAPLASLQPEVQLLAYGPRLTCHAPGTPVSRCRKSRTTAPANTTPPRGRHRRLRR